MAWLLMFIMPIIIIQVQAAQPVPLQHQSLLSNYSFLISIKEKVMKNSNKLLQKALLVIVMALPMIVNAQVCDYTTSSVTFNIGTPATLPSNSLTSYLLVDNATKTIVQISSTPTFSGIVQSKLYDVYAYSYVNNNTVTGKQIGWQTHTVIGNGFDKS